MRLPPKAVERWGKGTFHISWRCGKKKICWKDGRCLQTSEREVDVLPDFALDREGRGEISIEERE